MIDQDEDEWQVSWSDGVMLIEMPSHDEKRLGKAARKAGLSMENYVRCKMGFPPLDTPED